MASKASLQAHTRSTTGKGAARSLRRSGDVPGVIYGHHRQPESLQSTRSALTRLLVGAHSSTLVDVTVDDRAPVKALIREIQRNPLRGSTIVHLDLYEVRADEKITVEVPVQLVGIPDGVRNHGGVLDHQLHELEIEVLPADIPEHIEIDVTGLTIGQSLFVRDLTVAKADIVTDAEPAGRRGRAPRAEETPVAAADRAPATGEPELIRKPKADAEEEEK